MYRVAEFWEKYNCTKDTITFINSWKTLQLLKLSINSSCTEHTTSFTMFGRLRRQIPGATLIQYVSSHHHLKIKFNVTLIRGSYRKSWATFFLHANWEQQTKESAVVDGTSCCVILHRIPCERGNPCCRNSPETSACLWKCVHGCEQCSKMGETF